jgi:microcystin-dependent protein
VSDPFVAEIRIVPFNFAPKGWAFCNGQLMPISQNTALFSLLGTTYGGNGQTTFALPNLQGMSPLQQGQGAGLSLRNLGEMGGSDVVTLLSSQVPAHVHTLMARAGSVGDSTSPTNTALGKATYGRQAINTYSATAATPVAMHPAAIVPAGGSLPHNNLQPYLTLNFIIALQGIFPPRS